MPGRVCHLAAAAWQTRPPPLPRPSRLFLPPSPPRGGGRGEGFGPVVLWNRMIQTHWVWSAALATQGDTTMDLAARLLVRRRFLQLAGGTLGLHLGGLWRAQGADPRPGPVRSCILIFYYGGPSHLDTYDPKPDAPAE